MLRTLGGLALDAPNGTAPPVQRRRLLLLAALAAAGSRGVGRDALAALLWGESAEADARNSLKQAVAALRRAVGDAAFVTDGLMVRLDHAALPSDVGAFLAAIEAGDDAAAVAAYHGPFLDGVPLPPIAGFEPWVADTRAQLARRAREALLRLADAAARTGDWPAAARWGERLVSADPLDAPATLALVRALDAVGDRPRALRVARVHAARLRDELGVTPSPELVGLVAAWRHAAPAPTDPPPALPAATPETPATAPAPAPPVLVAGAGDAPAPRWDDALAPRELASAAPNASPRDNSRRDNSPRDAAPIEAPTVSPAGTRDGRPSAADENARRPLAQERPERRGRRVASLRGAGLAVAGALGLGAFGLAVASAVAGAPRVADRPAGGGAATDRAATPDTAVLAVLPFAVRDVAGVAPAAEAAGLRDGLVHLLAAALDGAGGLRTVDAAAVLRAAQRDPSEAPARGAPSGRDDASVTQLAGGSLGVARALGAAQYVDGAVLVAGDRLRITAALHDGRTPAAPPSARASAEGRPADLFALADSVAAQLLAARVGGAAGLRARTAATSGASLPAFRAYVDGERAFRGGRFADAVQAFQAAVAADSTFALAWYRLSVAADWAERIDLAQAASARAARHGARLTPGHRLLAEGLDAYRRADADAAERALRRAVAERPTDPEAWYQLGEVLFHLNYSRGRSVREARLAYERVLALAPDDVEAAVHLARLAAFDGDAARFGALARRVRAAGPPGQAREIAAVAAFRFAGSEAERRRVLAEAARLGDVEAHNLCTRVAVLSRGAAGDPLCAVLTAPERSPEARALGHWRLAELALARGQAAAATAHVAAMRAAVPEWADALDAAYAAHPAAAPTAASLQAARARLQAASRAAPQATGERTMPHFAVMNGKHAANRAYLDGWLAGLAGDTAGARRAAERLEQLAGSRDRGAQLAGNAALAVRALLLERAGQPAAALARLEAQRGDWQAGARWVGEAFATQHLRTRLLAALGRHAEAAGVRATIGEIETTGLGFCCEAAAVRLARIY